MSEYPQTIDFFTDKTDQVTDCKAVDINDLQDSVTKIQQTLGINPQGQNQPTGWTVASRLSVFINDNGTLKAAVLTSSDIPSGSITNSKIYYNDSFSFREVKTPSLIVYGAAQLGQSSTDITSFTGTLQPSQDLTYDIGTPTKRVKIAYIDDVHGTTTGGNTLTVSVSATFDNTLIIRSSTDTPSGVSTIGSIGKVGSDLAVQAQTGANLQLQPFGGGIIFPKMNTTQRNALSASEALIIYNTDTKSMQYYNGISWIDMANYSV